MCDQQNENCIVFLPLFLGASSAVCVDDMVTVFRSFYLGVRVCVDITSLQHWIRFSFLWAVKR